MYYGNNFNFLNLTKDFDPFYSQPSHSISFELITFFGGEPHIKLKKYPFDITDVMITQRIKSFNDIGLLTVAVDALRRINPQVNIELFVPYFPGARQDALRSYGEALTVKVYANIINSLKLNRVLVLDPHSDAVQLVVDNCIVINNHYFVKQVLNRIKQKYFNVGLPKTTDRADEAIAIICPDAGAQKKIYDLMSYLDLPDIELVKCDKHRDPLTGEITGFYVRSENLNGKECIIVDDICDGGGTFMGLATELKNKGAGHLHLAVSHGLFSKGFKNLFKYFTSIYTTDSWRTHISMETPEIEKNSEIVEIIKLEEIINNI